MKRAFRIYESDNVATLLDNAETGESVSYSADVPGITIREPIAAAHKLALVDIPKGGIIMKYGWPIGHALRDIACGEWVHLHNIASNYDERSSTLDLHSGSPTDTVNAYV